jgi:hypothetical protein
VLIEVEEVYFIAEVLYELKTRSFPDNRSVVLLEVKSGGILYNRSVVLLEVCSTTLVIQYTSLLNLK